jgi:cation diffusion facilitator family transporter
MSRRTGSSSAEAAAPRQESNVAIYASIGANVVIAATKLIAAAMTGSSAMVAEGVHSFVDASDGTLLLVGRRRSRRPPDADHPFGHGKELYFWTLIVAIVFFAVGGGMSVYEGILHILHPEPIRDPTVNYVVLGISALFDGSSFIIALRTLRREAPGQSIWHVVRHGKDPSLFTLVLEDIADITGLALAFLGVWLGHRLANPYLDGAASILIGLLLAGVALVLVAQSRSLLVGSRASADVLRAVNEAAEADPNIEFADCPLSMQLGPNEVLLGVRASFAPHLSRAEIGASIRGFEDRLRAARPEVRYLSVEPVRAEKPSSPPPVLAR